MWFFSLHSINRKCLPVISQTEIGTYQLSHLRQKTVNNSSNLNIYLWNNYEFLQFSIDYVVFGISNNLMHSVFLIYYILYKIWYDIIAHIKMLNIKIKCYKFRLKKNPFLSRKSELSFKR